MIDGAEIIMLAGLVGVACYLLTLICQEIAHRWRCRLRERMTAWQRRVAAGLEPTPGFEVRMARAAPAGITPTPDTALPRASNAPRAPDPPSQ
jgi:hypothetical protein